MTVIIPDRDRDAIAYDAWREAAIAKFGEDPHRWAFVCPSCGHVATVAEWIAAGAPNGSIAFACVGRWLGADGSRTFKLKGGPCNYTGGGLFGLNPVRVRFPDGHMMDAFAFAEVKLDEPQG